MDRIDYIQQITQLFHSHSVVALLGPRQVGKTTLAKQYAAVKAPDKIHIFDLEDPISLARLDNPKLALESLKGLIIIDEIQRKPELFTLIRVLVDNALDQKFLILGSASRDLIKQSTESLAGRIAFIELKPFGLAEYRDNNNNCNKLWLRGGFPRSILALDDTTSFEWRKYYIATFLERDVPSLGINIPPLQLRRFWMMLSHYNSNIFNATELGRSLGISDKTVKNYLDLLSGTFMIRQVQPWFENIGKRQVKAPKIYFRDTGILHNLLSIETYDDLISHPKLGASWEGFALEEITKTLHLDTEEVFFWATHNQAEIDLLTFQHGKRIAYEFKYTDAPKLTKSMQIAKENLALHQIFVIYPGQKSYNLDHDIFVVPLEHYVNNNSKKY